MALPELESQENVVNEFIDENGRPSSNHGSSINEMTRGMTLNIDTETQDSDLPVWAEQLINRSRIQEKLVRKLVDFVEEHNYEESEFPDIEDSELRSVGFSKIYIKNFRISFPSKENDSDSDSDSDSGHDSGSDDVVSNSGIDDGIIRMLPAKCTHRGIVITVQIHNWLYAEAPSGYEQPNLKDPMVEIAMMRKIFENFRIERKKIEDKEYKNDRKKYQIIKENITATEMRLVFDKVGRLIQKMDEEAQRNVTLCIFFGGHGFCVQGMRGVFMMGVDGNAYDLFGKYRDSLTHIPTIVITDCCRTVYRKADMAHIITKRSIFAQNYCYWTYSCKLGVESLDGAIYTQFIKDLGDEVDQSILENGASNTNLVQVLKNVLRDENGDDEWYRENKQFDFYLGGCRDLKDITQPTTKPEAVSSEEPLQSVSFSYEYDFDKNGLLYYIGTNYLQEQWVNPHQKGAVMVTRSTNCGGSGTVDMFVGREINHCHTGNELGSFFEVDLRRWKIRPITYTLRSYNQGNGGFLKSWKLEGSVDGENYVVLDEQKLSSRLCSNTATASFSITNISEDFFRYFRIVGTGKDANSQYYVCSSGFEVYGDALCDLSMTHVSWEEKRKITAAHFPTTNPVEEVEYKVKQTFVAGDDTTLNKNDIVVAVDSEGNFRRENETATFKIDKKDVKKKLKILAL